jgi:CHAD domain-containing protein
VAVLHTRRQVTELRDAEGRVLAEVADDHVTGTALSPEPGAAAVVTAWRELEVELVDGDEALLAAVAEAVEGAGARPAASPSKLARVLADRLADLDGAPPPTDPEPATGTKGKKGKKGKGKKSRKREQADGGDPGRPAGEVVRAVLRDQVAALQDADLMVRTGQPDAVHQVRVACRRLRSILAAFRPVLDRAQTDPLRQELADVGAALSGGRDAEVALGHLRALVAEQPEELVLGPVAARLQQAEIKELQAAEGTARKVLSGEAYLQLRDDLDALLADPPLAEHAAAAADVVAREVLARTAKRLRRGVHAAMDTDDPAALHDVRKAAKRVRYTAEAVVPVLGEPVAELVGALKDVQDVLGARQDTVVTRELCTRIGLQAFGAGENAWTYGRLHGLEEARAERAEQDFWACWPVLGPVLKAAARP